MNATIRGRQLALEVVFEVPGVPPNWSNSRLHHQAKAREIALWRERAWYAAASARNSVGWPMPLRTEPPAPRWVSFTLYKHPPLYDADGASSACKPLQDGLHGFRELPGHLLVDDSLQWCRVWSPVPGEPVLQVAIPRKEPERTVIRVSLVQPSEVGR